MTRTLAFTKGQGTGNDFVLVSDPDGEADLTPDEVARLCDRHFGIGADGVLRAVRSKHLDDGAAALAEEPAAEWFMDYRNADGSVAEMCGNGIRVFTAYLLANRLAEIPEGGALPIGTRAGVKRIRAAEDGFTADMGTWRHDDVEWLVAVPGIDVARPGLGIDVGNPHVVVALAEEGELDALELHTAPHVDPVPEHGANVEFVVPNDPLISDGVGGIRMRVHERGSGETLSCGTGAVASALATRYWAGEGAPDEWTVDVPGGRVRVTMTADAGVERVHLTGPAELVYRGTFEL